LIKAERESGGREKLLFTGKEVFPFPPNLLSFFKKSGVFWGSGVL
jgi:hypothetical protein